MVDLLLELPEVRRTLNDVRSFTEGFSPLHAAVAGGHQAAAEKLLDMGAHINALDHQNRHSLFIAVESGTPAMVDMLIRRGADVEKGPLLTDRAQPMLHKINLSHYKETLLLLVAAGADVNGADSQGQTALYKVAAAHDPDKVKNLLDLGADPDIASSYGRRPLDAVVADASYYFSQCYAIAGALLAANANPDMAPSTKVTSAPLHQAARAGRRELVKLLLDHGAIVDEPDRVTGATPWLVGVETLNIPACDLLREKGADTAKKDSQLRSVLHYAAKSGANAQLERGLADPALAGQVDTPDATGSTPLHLATYAQKTDCARVLLAAGANPVAYDATGMTPMHYIARGYNDTMFMAYDKALGKRADWNVQTRDTKETPLHLAAKIGYSSIITRLLQAETDISLKDRRGHTPLLAAIAADQAGAAQQLLARMKEKKIPLEGLVDGAGQSPLHLAVASMRWSLATLTIVLDAGASVNARTPEGDTPLHIAVRTGRADVMALLTQRGADVTLANKEGMTPLDLAMQYGQQPLVDQLQKALKEQQQKDAVLPPPPRAANRPSMPGP